MSAIWPACRAGTRRLTPQSASNSFRLLMGSADIADYLNAQRFYFLAEQSLNIMKKGLSELLREHGLTHSQHLILLVLRYAEFSEHRPMSTDIAYLLGLEKHSITAVVDKLVADGLVERTRSDEDRRVVHLGLTAAGRELSATVHEKTIATISVVPDHARDEFARMCGFLESLRDHIASASGQPGEMYARAYQTLLLDGQDAFRANRHDPADSP